MKIIDSQPSSMTILRDPWTTSFRWNYDRNTSPARIGIGKFPFSDAYLELGYDINSGEIRKLTIVYIGTIKEPCTTYSLDQIPNKNLGPVLDPNEYGLEELDSIRLDSITPQIFGDDNLLQINLTNTTPVRWLRSGPVAIGVDNTNELAVVLADISAYPTKDIPQFKEPW